MSDVRIRVLVRGRVQGVWFRESTRQRAGELGVRGWVRNLPDGRVEALFEGDEAGVRAAVDYVREGPRMARVLEVCEHAEVISETSPEVGFRVR